jgi:hypothetical protein
VVVTVLVATLAQQVALVAPVVVLHILEQLAVQVILLLHLQRKEQMEMDLVVPILVVVVVAQAQQQLIKTVVLETILILLGQPQHQPE